jgi:integrase/recombinase XerD
MHSDHGAGVELQVADEVEMGLLVRAAPLRRDRILIEVGYAGGLRVSELVALIWSDVIERDGGRVQLSVLGKGHKRREVLLPEVVSRSLLSLSGDAGTNDPVFASPRGGHLTERAVNYMLKRAAINAGINPKLSAHWLRHASLPCRWCNRHSVTATSQSRQTICTRGPASRAGCISIQGCFFNEDED